MVHRPVVVLLIIAVGLTAPVIAAVFAFRRPSLVFLLLLLGAGFLWLSPPLLKITTDASPDHDQPVVTKRAFGHWWEAAPAAPPDNPYRSTSYEINWPQFGAEGAVLVVVVTGLYFLLRYVLARERAAVGRP